jgi:trehalose 6-phosphate phosphatase
MIHLFDEGPKSVLVERLFNPTILAFDFDGTLAPIVDDRDSALMRPETNARFIQLCEQYRCAVVTGRSRKDVTGRLGLARVWKIVGHHGLETGATTTSFTPEVAEAARFLNRLLTSEPGVEMEDKGLSLAIHFRKAKRPQQAINAIHAAVTRLPMRMRRVDGKAVVNLVPEQAPDKGDAIVALRQESSAASVLYVGDDVTDEDVFKLRQPSWLVTVRIGRVEHSGADYYLRDQSEIDRLLDALLRLRTPDTSADFCSSVHAGRSLKNDTSG